MLNDEILLTKSVNDLLNDDDNDGEVEDITIVTSSMLSTSSSSSNLAQLTAFVAAFSTFTRKEGPKAEARPTCGTAVGVTAAEAAVVVDFLVAPASGSSTWRSVIFTSEEAVVALRMPSSGAYCEYSFFSANWRSVVLANACHSAFAVVFVWHRAR